MAHVDAATSKVDVFELLQEELGASVWLMANSASLGLSGFARERAAAGALNLAWSLERLALLELDP